MMVQDNLENRPVGDYPVCTVHGWTWAYAPCQYCRAERAEEFARVCNAKTQSYLEQLAVEMARVEELEDELASETRWAKEYSDLSQRVLLDLLKANARVKELEEALREIAHVRSHDQGHEPQDTLDAAIAIAERVLGGEE